MSGVNLKLPAHVLFRKDLSLMLWKPHGVLDEVIVNEIVAFIDFVEERASKPFNRFADLSALDMVDLNFKFVFHIGPLPMASWPLWKRQRMSYSAGLTDCEP